MNASEGAGDCPRNCWIAAIAAGIVLAIILLIADWSFLLALLVGVIVAVVGNFVLKAIFCRSEPDLASQSSSTSGASAAPTPAAPKPAAAPEKPAEPKPAAPATSAPAPAESDDDEGSRPKALSGPRGGVADDLKKIKGVGPKLEGTLNELGFYHFDQIAAWTASEVAWVDTRLKFKGRIDRDDWIGQAKQFVAGD